LGNEDPEFKQEMKKRNGIEGTQSELVRAHGARRARYRGLDKVKLQFYLIGAACNVKRWLRRAVGRSKKPCSRIRTPWQAVKELEKSLLGARKSYGGGFLTFKEIFRLFPAPPLQTPFSTGFPDF